MKFPSITSISAIGVVAPLKRPVRTAVGTLPNSPLVIISIHTNHDIVGNSYIFGYTHLTLQPLVEFIKSLKEILIGQEIYPYTISKLLESKFKLLGKQGLVGMALSGIDMALWDAFSKFNGNSVANQLGAKAEKLRCYDSYGIIDLDKDYVDIEKSLTQGFKAIKVKIGDSELEKDINTVSRLREFVGPKIKLMIDFNQGLSAPEAIRRIQALEQFNLEWVEEPVSAEDLIGHASVRKNSNIPIQTGENWWFIEDMAKSISEGASDLAMPDIMKVGGVTGWIEIASLAKVASLPVSNHIFSDISAHVMAATPTYDWVEYLDTAGAVQLNPIQIIDGYIFPEGPGFGIIWDDNKIEHYKV